jgi:subtilisin family serine protease
MATPFVSAVAALLLSRNPSLTADQVEAALRSTAVDLGEPGFDHETGWGLIRAGAAAWSIDPPASDGAAPSVRISGISDGTMVRGTKSLTITATDPAPIVALRLYRDGAYDRVRRTASHALSWNTNAVKDGIHRWQAYGTDAGLNAGTTLTRVLVANDRSVGSLRASTIMTSTRRSLTKTITLRRTTPFVARLSAPAGTSVRLRLVSSSGKVLADVRGTGVAVIALSSVRYGRYSLRSWAAVATPGRTLAVRADWFR